MKEQGLSLLELLTTLAIVSILTLSALPAVSAWQRQLSLQTSTQAVMRSLALARQEAVIRGVRVQMAGNGAWENGWKIFADLNSDNSLDDGEPLIFAQMPLQNIRIRGNKPVSAQVTFREDGLSVLPNGGLQLGTLTLCPVPTTNVAYAIRIARGGRARVEQVSAADCLDVSE